MRFPWSTPGRPAVSGAACFPVSTPDPARLDTVEPDVRVVEKRMEQTHGIRAAADARHARIGQTAFLLEHLSACLAPDDRVEVTHHHRIRMRTRHRADDVVRVVDVAHPVAHRFVEGVLEGLRPDSTDTTSAPRSFMREDVGRLPFDVLGSM